VLVAAGREGQAAAGEQEIPLDRVVGSASGKAKLTEFDPGFLPLSQRMRDRWTRVYTTMTEGGDMPPIDVYKVGDNYYVSDGHHRVSVARSLGRQTIPARVTEVRTRAPIGPDVDPAALLRAAEYKDFLEATHLDRTRPGARLECSRLGRYDEILRHIAGHAYFLGLERSGEPVSVEEAAASWYDNVYLPVIDVIRRHGVLDHLPGWTETDLYVEVTRRWLELSEAGEESGPHRALHRLADEGVLRALNWWGGRRRPLRLD
jgi:ParB-like nuclease domain